MQVLKFGGSSVASATAISRVLDIVSDAAGRGRMVLVSSAISGATDLLIECSKSDSGKRQKLLEDLKNRHFEICRRLFTGRERTEACERLQEIFNDLSQSPLEDYPAFGELLSTSIIAGKLNCDGVRALWIDSRELIRCNENGVDYKLTYERIRKAIHDHPEIEVFVAPGFIASKSDGKVCTLGRGGSDYSAAIYAAALQADRLQIWTDVPGIMTCNPKDVKKARTIGRLSYESAFALASHGAKVLYAPTVEPARQAGIDIEILNSLDSSQSGSIICAQKAREKGEWVGIASQKKDSLSQICLVADGAIDPDDCRELERRMHKYNIPCSPWTIEDGNCCTCTLPRDDEGEALKLLHRQLFETEDRKRIYLAGCGAVGQALLQIIDSSSAKVEVVAISRHESEDDAFFQQLLHGDGESRIFVDCTDSEEIWKRYCDILEAGVNIVSSNRRAFSIGYKDYARIKSCARRNRCFLRYETTVGTALPILNSIASSTNSADEILSLQAVVSCTLNYILTSGLPFKEALERAKEIKLTEKDPSQDLSGRDALRKLLILAREAGIALEESDVKIEPVSEERILPGQRFVASLEKDADARLGYRAGIRLENLDPEHPALRLKGTENMVIIRSAFQPSALIVQGAGEGARMAASGVLNDILR